MFASRTSCYMLLSQLQILIDKPNIVFLYFAEDIVFEGIVSLKGPGRTLINDTRTIAKHMDGDFGTN